MTTAQKTIIGHTAVTHRPISLERKNGIPFVKAEDKTFKVCYNFSRSEDKRRVITRMEEIIGDVLSAYNDLPEYLSLKEQLNEIMKQEKSNTL